MKNKLINESVSDQFFQNRDLADRLYWIKVSLIPKLILLKDHTMFEVCIKKISKAFKMINFFTCFEKFSHVITTWCGSYHIMRVTWLEIRRLNWSFVHEMVGNQFYRSIVKPLSWNTTNQLAGFRPFNKEFPRSLKFFENFRNFDDLKRTLRA